MKRVIAVSDSHGDSASLREALDQARRKGAIHAVVFLGDGVGDFDAIRPQLSKAGIQCYAVRGNNDWSTSEETEILFRVNGVKFFACHGHTLHVKYGLDRLWYAAREHEASVLLYGHTHREKIDLEYGMTFINPGAVCERSFNRSAYAEILVEDNGFVIPSLCRWE